MTHTQSKRLVFGTIPMLFIFLYIGTGAAHAQTPPPTSHGPQAVLPVTHFEFPPVFEGQEVRHEFVIQNKGTAALDIMNVQTG